MMFVAKPIAITMGEPAGISGEITLKTWSRIKDFDTPYMAIDNIQRLESRSKQLNLNFPIVPIEDPLEATEIYKDALPVINIDLANQPELGNIDQSNTSAIIASIDLAARLAGKEVVSGVVTNPVHKQSLYSAGFQYPGHTEYLAAICGADIEPVMMLSCNSLRTVPVTTHLSLRDSITALSVNKIVSQTTITAGSLCRDFGIKTPRLAIAGLNPHAGEDGSMGDEEKRIIIPAIRIIRNQGINIIGPIAPDSMFSKIMRETYDVAICMFHDQALIPIKTLDFSNAVNVTLGLPFVRTSPDHGTALDIAHKGIADESSMTAAFLMAAEIARNRSVLQK